jgi:hypothetical protein
MRLTPRLDARPGRASSTARPGLCVLLALPLAAAPGARGGDDGPGAADGGPADDAAGDGSADGGDGAILDLGPDLADCPDADSDGHSDAACGGDHCDDADPRRYPGATEVCDAAGLDEDCDPATYGRDADRDAFEDAACCNGPGNCGADCDDTLATVNPRAAEVCNGGVDDDRDGRADADDGVCVPCPPGYVGLDAACTDVDECATPGFCGTGAARCEVLPGTFACACAAGYRAATPTDALCEDIDECGPAPGACGDDASTCRNVAGGHACTCRAGFVAPPSGRSCLWNDPALTGLGVSSGAAVPPAFSPGTTSYVVSMRAVAEEVTLTPTVAESGRTTITVDGATVASGAGALVLLGAGFRPVVVSIVVRAESGATRTTTVTIVRQPRYLEASNTQSLDWFGSAVALSADGTTLVVGAAGGDSNARGIDGDPRSEAALESGAVHVYRGCATALADAGPRGEADVAPRWRPGTSGRGTRERPAGRA